MAVFLKNVTFHGILLDAIMDQTVGNKEEWLECARLLESGINSGIVQPLPNTVFSSDKSEEAFRFVFFQYFYTKCFLITFIKF